MREFLETWGVGASEIVAVLSVIVAVISLFFAVYVHVVNRKRASLFYEISQLADVDAPKEIFGGIMEAPVLLEIQSVGNKSAENVKIFLRTKNDISRAQSVPSNLITKHDSTTLSLKIDAMNPMEKLKMIVFCEGSPAFDQVDELLITHSEGVGRDRKSKEISFTSSILGFGLDFAIGATGMHLKRIGPFRFD